MKEFLNQLNVFVLDENDYKTLEKAIKNNALGSDLPRSLLAQYFAFLHTMQKFNEFVMCPMVIDSPKQQEQDKSNVDAIFKFIFKNTLPKQQLVVGTVSLDFLSDDIIPENAKRVRLEGKFGLLRPDEYEEVLAAR